MLMQESAIAGASQDATPRIGILLSSFRGSSEHDGSPISGLRDPQPVGAQLSAAQIDAMVRKAIELAETRKGRIQSYIEPEDWVLLLCGEIRRLEIVRSLLSYLAGKKAGARFTVARASCAGLCSELSRAYPGTRFEARDLASEVKIELPVPWTIDRRRLAPATLQRCDKVISIAQLGIAPTFANYARFASPSAGAEAVVDVFSLHPPDFSFVWGERNVLIAGARPVSVDAVASAALGYKPAAVACLHNAYKRGLGILDIDSMWTRGNEIEEAAKALREERS